jgi:hypothetical protein
MFDKKQNGLTGDDSCYAEVVRVFAIYIVGLEHFPEILFNFPIIHWEKKLLKWVLYEEILLQNMSHISHICHIYKNRFVAKECECSSKQTLIGIRWELNSFYYRIFR